MSQPPGLQVTCALIPRNGRLLLAQRADTGLWEFPGGKAEAGEALEECLIREIQEELGVLIQVVEPLDRIKGATHQGHAMTLHAFLCRLVKGEPRALEHRALAWLEPDELQAKRLCPADRELVQRLSGVIEGESGKI